MGCKNMNKRSSVGGQAVIEGVMMRGNKGIATAVRKSDGSIVVDVKETIPYTKKNKILGLPIIRGFVSLVESMVVGIQSLNYSASFFEDDGEESTSKFDELLNNLFKENSENVIMGISMFISMALAVGIFFILPTFSANLFKRFNVKNPIVLNLIEGLIRVFIFIVYLVLIGKMKDINRLFQYHGAEHKTVFCYEHDEELTPNNASKYATLHPRCGTNFMFLVMIVSIILFSFTGWKSLGFRIVTRIIMLPIVSGVTYELIRLMGRSDNKILSLFAYPGIMLQKLTTREPDDSQLEVAIKALKAAEGVEQ
jgi:uncharacterized protein YqhQ